MQVTQKTLVEMLEYKRPQGSKFQRKYCNRFLRPTFGQPDAFGNYCHVIGDKPRIAFMSHHDTVHATQGRQSVVLRDGRLRLAHGESSNCLGADCTAGNWLSLWLAQRGVPAVYCVFAAEESGCRGSRYMLESRPDWLSHVEIAISLDRKGTGSIITHQASRRTASDTFADSLAMQLGGAFEADPTGLYTDSEVFADDISECTNLSVGYYDQHSSKESQDAEFLFELAESLLCVDWSKIRAARDHTVTQYNDIWADFRGMFGAEYSKYRANSELDDLAVLVEQNPTEIAALLQSLGYDYSTLIDDCQLHEYSRGWR